MDQETLVAHKERAGRRLTRELLKDDQLGLTASFWWYEPDAESWTLVVASELCRTDGPRSAYKRIRRGLERSTPKRVSSSAISLSDIAAVADTDPRVVAMASAINVKGGSVRLTANVLNGVYVHDALAYELQSPSKVKAKPRDTKKPDGRASSMASS